LTRLSVRDFILSPPPNSSHELLNQWDIKLNTENLQPFFKLPLLVRQGLIEGKISVARSAELLGIETGEMEELSNHWAAEVSNEAAN